MEILYIIIAVLLATSISVAVLLISRKHHAQLLAGKEAAEAAAAEADRRRAEVEAASAGELRQKNEQVNELTGKLARAETLIETLRDQGARDREELEKLQASFRIEFRNLANDILEEKSTQFKKSNKESLDTLLAPFRESISTFRERVESIYSDENQQRGALKSEIKNLMDLNRRITEETTNLTNALKGNSKVQGDWGEMILETILESSNLVSGVHYDTQQNLKDESGSNFRPDVILKLPEDKRIVIDSKVSLTAFVAYMEAADEVDRRRLLDEHVQSVRKHVAELGNKGYHELLDSPDFVIMFIPNEPAFLAALQCDSTIWSDAYRRKVIVSSPTNLFALLKIVHDLWRREEQRDNALRIATEGGKLHDKFVGFYESMESVGKGIRNASESYEKAMGQLKTGRGNLVGYAEKLRRLGVKAAKALPGSVAGDGYEEAFGEDERAPGGSLAEGNNDGGGEGKAGADE